MYSNSLVAYLSSPEKWGCRIQSTRMFIRILSMLQVYTPIFCPLHVCISLNPDLGLYSGHGDCLFPGVFTTILQTFYRMSHACENRLPGPFLLGTKTTVLFTFCLKLAMNVHVHVQSTDHSVFMRDVYIVECLQLGLSRTK